MSSPPNAGPVDESMAALTAALWEQLRPVVRTRLESLRQWVEAGQPAEQLAEAVRTAHNLSGSLGSYGRHDGSLAARTLEQALLAGAEPAQIAELLTGLHAVVDA